MAEPFAGVTPILPEWPEVRCDNCRRVYTMPPERREGLVTGRCPRCGGGIFSTTMRGMDGAMLVDVPSPAPTPRQEGQ